MKNDNLNLMEGDIVNEESSIYNTAKPAAKETVEPKKPDAPHKIEFSSFKKFIPKFKIVMILLMTILVICLGFLVVAQRNTKQDHQQVENTVTNSPIPTATTDPKIVDLAKKVEQFKKDTDESTVTKKLTPPNLDLDLKF